jgi:alcohol dehydrogenase class IV
MVAGERAGGVLIPAVLRTRPLEVTPVANPSTFSAPTEIIAGIGAIEQLEQSVERFAPQRVAVVADRGVSEAGLLDEILKSLARWETRVCGLILPDPTTDDVEVVTAEAIEYGADLVVSVGGGSGLAAGKAVALRLRNRKPITEYAGRDQAKGRPLPNIAIPTTAGSGSEVSNALVLRDPRRQAVLVVRGRGYEPDIAILDGMLLATLPRERMVYAALDALSHAIEALWARKASSFTDVLAYGAAELIHRVLPRALESRRTEDLQTLLEASAMANLACGSSELGLVHALSLSTAVELPHGYQNAVLMPHVAAFNRTELPERTQAEIDRILPLYDRIEFDPHFRRGELGTDEVESMVQIALAVPLSANNVRHATADQLRKILAAAGATTAVSGADA